MHIGDKENSFHIGDKEILLSHHRILSFIHWNCSFSYLNSNFKLYSQKLLSNLKSSGFVNCQAFSLINFHRT